MSEWMTRHEIAEHLGIVVNSVRGKVQKGQIERKIEDGKNLYRLAEGAFENTSLNTAVSQPVEVERIEPTQPTQPTQSTQLTQLTQPEQPTQSIQPIQPIQPTEPSEVTVGPPKPKPDFVPKQALLNQLASVKVGRNIDAIEKGDEIDLATGEISRELDAKISMRQHRQIKEIEEALERLKLGEYGMCEECGDPIPEQRLRLYPAARYCVRCQEEADHYERIRQSQGLRDGGLREESTEPGFVGTFDE